MKQKNYFYLLHLLAIVLTISLFVPPMSWIWFSMDAWIFHALNSPLVYHPLQQIFWALGNIKVTDIFGALFLFTSFLLYIFEANGEERRKRIAQFLYTIVWFEISILFCKQLVTPICEHFHLARHGPTTLFSDAFMLSKIVPWCKVKDTSYFCYPADHAAIVFQWCAFMWFFAGWKRGLFVLLVSCFFLLPRLISGGHWASDLIVGSGSIVMMAIAWATCTSIYPKMMGYLGKFVSLCSTNRLLSKPHLLVKIALFGIFDVKFFNHMFTYGFKIFRQFCSKNINFSKQSEIRKKSNEWGCNEREKL